mgnify:CR=1 FL=1
MRRRLFSRTIPFLLGYREMLTVTDLLHNATYDQIVLSLCFAAVVVTGSMMHLSAHIGNVTRGRRTGGNERTQRLKLQTIPENETTVREKAA